MTDDRRFVAFDSNVLTYFLDGNRGNYRLAPDDPLADQRIAAVRLFLYCSPFIVPTVRDEASSILDHPRGPNDCRIVAEVEEDGGLPILVTFDDRLKRDLGQHIRLRIESPVDCWSSYKIPRGTPPTWTPASRHPLANERWWRWE